MLPNSLIPTALPKAQFRAVITCGYGSDLYPLIEPVSVMTDEEDGTGSTAGAGGVGGVGVGGSASKKTGQVKALLPVVGKKMIDWVLERVEEAGVFDILVLSPISLASPIAHHLRARRTAPSTSNLPSGTPSAKIELEEVPETVARQGSVALLKWATENTLIRSDFILLPCDLLLTPAPSSTISLASLIDRHRTDDNLMTTLFSERSAGNVVEARKDGPSEILTVYDRKTSTLLDIREMDEYDEDEVPLRTSLLERFPSPTLSTTLLPCQVYIFSSLILPLLTSSTHARRVRHMENTREFAGWVARLAWRNGGKDAIGYRDPRLVQREEGLAMGRSSTQPPVGVLNAGAGGPPSSPFPFSAPHTGANTPALVSRSSWLRSSISGGTTLLNDWDLPEGLLSRAAGKKNRAGAGGCKIVIWRGSDGWCGRGNTVAGFVEMNRSALKLLPPQPPATNTPSGVFISPDSWLHPSVHANLGEKVGVKRSIIGKGCFVGKLTKLTNVVLMDGVHIGENCKMDNCVVSCNVQIRDRASLKDCEIGQDYIVEADATNKNEQLVVEVE